MSTWTKTTRTRSKSKELKCDEKSGPVTELKVGTEDNQRIVAVEPRDSGKGTKFALVYVHTQGQERRYLGHRRAYARST